jgi:5-methylcytosine-specific restriction endonuclease McrA
MPDELPRLCIKPNCPNLQRPGRSYCTAHDNEASKEWRESASGRGYNRKHRAWRLLVIARHPVCDECHEQPSVVADHIRDLDTFAPGESGAWTLENGRGLCLRCHNAKSGRKGNRAMRESIY